ncbi:MAG: hypothetical protein NTZ09_02050, partial [Candidatus Hydrogenedentes bacterium]|nr:hypothetical protein [Candidatus Hydrogenedentota bacterium]
MVEINARGIAAICLLAYGWLAGASGAAEMRLPEDLGEAAYAALLRGADGRVDADAMVARLKDLGASTYYWLVWQSTDWEDLKSFLPKAAEAGIEVWPYLVPPSESPPNTTSYSEPFRLDYQRWAEEIAGLSLEFPNLAAWVIDDFYANKALYTPGYLRDMQARAHRVNPKLAFLPLMYFNEIDREFVEAYREVIDGVVVAYPQDRDEIAHARAMLNDEVMVMPGQLSFPAAQQSVAGDFVRISQAAKVLPADKHIIRFRELDDFYGTTAGYHFKQFLVDDTVVWEQDVQGGGRTWQEVAVDVTAQVAGKKAVTLAFQLMEKQGVGNFPVRWRMTDLQAEGVLLTAGLDAPKQWQVGRKGEFSAGFGDAIKEGGHSFRIPFVVMTAAQDVEFR